MPDRKNVLSALWLFAVLNYLYCDVVSLMDADLLKQYLTGEVGGMKLTQGFLFGGAVLMEISIAMVLLSRLLKPAANRWANIGAGVVTTLAQSATLAMGRPAPYYLFFSVFEITTTGFIIWYAWRWNRAKKPREVMRARSKPRATETAPNRPKIRRSGGLQRGRRRVAAARQRDTPRRASKLISDARIAPARNAVWAPPPSGLAAHGCAVGTAKEVYAARRLRAALARVAGLD